MVGATLNTHQRKLYDHMSEQKGWKMKEYFLELQLYWGGKC